MSNCPVCNTNNLDFSVRCVSCGSFLQQSVKTLDLFSTIYNIWRNPPATLRKILLAEHKNYTLVIAVFEAVGLSFLSMFIFKAADIYSIELWKLIVMATGLGVVLFFPAIYLSTILSFLILRPGKRGVKLKGFISGTVYSMHPLAFGAVVFLPAGLAVFGPYLFSNNPSPAVINPAPFYLLGILDFVAIVASLLFIVTLIRTVFGKKIRSLFMSAILLGVFVASLEIAKSFLLAH